MVLWPGNARESQKIIAVLMIQKVLFKIQRCKNWLHQFLFTKVSPGVMLPVFALFVFFKKPFLFIRFCNRLLAVLELEGILSAIFRLKKKKNLEKSKIVRKKLNLGLIF